MTNSSSAIRTNENVVYLSKEIPQEVDPGHQEISSVAQDALENSEINRIKEKLSFYFQFDKFCDQMAIRGAKFSDDRKYVIDLLGKKILFSDLECNFYHLKNTVLLFIQDHGCCYNPIESLLTHENGTFLSTQETNELMTEFHSNQEIMANLAKQLQNSIVEEVDVQDDYEEIKSVIQRLMVYEDFVDILKKRGWNSDQDEMIDPEGKRCPCKELHAKWRYLKNVLHQSIKNSGFSPIAKSNLFQKNESKLSLGEVYDLIKERVIKEFVLEAQLMGFDQKGNLFFKNDSCIAVSEVLIQVNLNYIGLYTGTDEELIKKKLIRLEAIYAAIDFDAVKSVVNLFLCSKQFMTLLKERGWVVHGSGPETIVSLQSKSYFLSEIVTKWKQQKYEVIHSLIDSGFAYNKHLDLFVNQQMYISINEVYDLIKHEVVDQLVAEAYLLGFEFDLEQKLFVKEGKTAETKEVMIQVHLKHIGLEDIL